MGVMRADDAPGVRSLEPATARREASALSLLARAAGPPWRWPGKWWRFFRTLWNYVDTRGIRKKLARLQAAGLVDEIPTRGQLITGSYDMLRFWISPAAADYYQQIGISYGFHQLLRFLDEPASLTDPVGLVSTRDAIIGHVLQVVHANPEYDMQLLMMFPDGLEQMELQSRQMIDGSHPRAAAIGAIVEEPDYHQRLLSYVARFRRDGHAPPLLRSNITADGPFAEIESVFGSLTTAMRYFCSLPRGFRASLRHMRRVKTFAGHLDPERRDALTANEPSTTQ